MPSQASAQVPIKDGPAIVAGGTCAAAGSQTGCADPGLRAARQGATQWPVKI